MKKHAQLGKIQGRPTYRTPVSFIIRKSIEVKKFLLGKRIGRGKK